MLSFEQHDFRTIACAKCGRTVTFAVRCRNRFCRTCSTSSASRIRKRIRCIVDNTEHRKGYTWKFVTLTIKSEPQLDTMLDHAITAFRRMRQRSEWKQNVDGGIYVIEITRSDHGWHVHIHAIISARFWQQYRISSLWNLCSGSPVVDIRNVRSLNLIGYLTAYLSKNSLNDNDADIAGVEMRDRRLFQPFGCLSAIASKFLPRPSECQNCGCHDWFVIGSTFPTLHYG